MPARYQTRCWVLTRAATREERDAVVLSKQIPGAGAGGAGGSGAALSTVTWLQKPLGAAKTGSLLGFWGSWEHQLLNQPLRDARSAKPCRGGLGCPGMKGFYPSFAGANANWRLRLLSPAAGEH